MDKKHAEGKACLCAETHKVLWDSPGIHGIILCVYPHLQAYECSVIGGTRGIRACAESLAGYCSDLGGGIMKTRNLIPGIIRKMNDTYEESDLLAYENTIARMFFAPLLILGAITTFLARYFYLHEDWKTFLLDCLVLFGAGLFCEIYSRAAKNEKMKEYVMTALFSAMLVYMVLRLYYLMGTSVWLYAGILILISLLRIKKNMLIVISFVTFTLWLYVMFFSGTYSTGLVFYTSQTVAIVFLITIAIVVHRLLYARFLRSYAQFHRSFVSEAKLKSTLTSVGDGVIAVDTDGRVDFLNPVAERLTGWKQNEAKGKPFETVFFIVNEYSRERLSNPMKEVFATGQIVELANHTVLIARDGSEKAIEDTAAPIKNEEGVVVGCVLVFRDFSEKKERQRKIEYLSYHDQLTGTYNRRYFEEEVKRLDKARNLPISLIYADLNGLKTINDAFGHQVGDQFIFQAAETIRNVCRADDIIARIGGDEFVILLPKTDIVSTEKLAHRLKAKIERAKINDISVSVSFGWGTKENEEQTIESVLKSAEDLMYQQKILSNAGKRNEMIKVITKALQNKCPWESEHARRVGTICASIGEAFNLPDDEVRELKTAGALHDIGKIALDEGILNNPDNLSDAEWAQMKDHPDTGYRILSTSSEYYNIAEYILAHHEHMDGTGYPKGLKGEAILWKARIIAIAEAYDSMTFDRPSRKAITQDKAVAKIRENAGTQFDAEIAKVFVETVLGDIW